MKVVVLNTVLSNTGDAAIFEAIEHSLRHELAGRSLKVTALDSAAREARGRYPSWNVLQQPTRSAFKNHLVRAVGSRARTALVRFLTNHPHTRSALLRFGPRTELLQSLREISTADLVLSSGGTYLVDHYDFRHRVTEISFARSVGKKVYLWTQSLGPFTTQAARDAAEKLLPQVEGVFFRDDRSATAWTRLRPAPAISAVCADAVFALCDFESSPRRDVQTGRVALLSVREWDRPVAGGEFDFERYSGGMRAIASGLLARGWRCVAVSTCQGVPGYRIDDSKTAAKIFADMDVTIDRSFHSPSELGQILRSADLVIATRMHMAILSLINRVPVIAVAYETKSIELFASLGRSESVTPIESVDEDWAARIVSTIDPADSGALLNESELIELSADARQPAREVVRAMENGA